MSAVRWSICKGCTTDTSEEAQGELDVKEKSLIQQDKGQETSDCLFPL